jgi:hypothetical protein
MKRQTAEAEAERQEQLVRKQNLAMQSNVPRGTALPSVRSMESQSGIGAQSGVTESEGQTSSSRGLSGQSVLGQTLPAQSVPVQSLEERVKDLRKQVERVVKAPGAPLKTAPFHTASTLQSLTTGTEVLILISTPYWYGVETHEGQHGWMMRDQLEQP